MAQYDQERRGRQRDDNWARQVPWNRGQAVAPYERERMDRWRALDWNKEGGYGTTKEDGPYTGIGPRGYQRSDARIFEDVCERLTRHGRIDARQIEVQVNNGEVTLTGSVDSRQVKHMTEMTVERVEGVKDVRNLLRVEAGRRRESGQPGGGSGRVDHVGRSGIYPASGPRSEGDAEVRGMASWGQGERGSAGYEESGRSELNITSDDSGETEKND